MLFTFIDIILFIGISQGIFLATTLKLVHKSNEAANRILSVTILIAVFMLIGRVLAVRLEGPWVSKVAVLADTTIFLFGPLMYLYFRRLSFQESPLYKLPLVHYSLAFTHLMYALFFAFGPTSIIAAYQQGKSVQIIGFMIETIGLLTFIYYTFKAMMLLKKFDKGVKNALSYELKVNTYLRCLLGALIISVSLWLTSYLCGYILRIYLPYINYTSVWVSTPIFIYVIGYFSLKQPEIFRVPFTPKQKEERPRLKPDEIALLQKRLLYHVKEEHIYLKSDLTLKELAGRMDTSGNNLSWLLNQVYQKSFYEYINELRVKEVIKRIESGTHLKHTILSIALDAGFNTKSTFNKVFKKYTGYTPTQYIKTKNVA